MDSPLDARISDRHLSILDSLHLIIISSCCQVTAHGAFLLYENRHRIAPMKVFTYGLRCVGEIAHETVRDLYPFTSRSLHHLSLPPNLITKCEAVHPRLGVKPQFPYPRPYFYKRRMAVLSLRKDVDPMHHTCTQPWYSPATCTPSSRSHTSSPSKSPQSIHQHLSHSPHPRNLPPTSLPTQDAFTLHKSIPSSTTSMLSAVTTLS